LIKLKIDREADALYLTLDESATLESEEVAPGVILDYNDKGEVVGIEMLYLSRRSPGLDVRRFMFESVEGVVGEAV